MYLLDTCVFSELTKKKPVTKVKDWILERDESSLFVSALSFGEIHKGIEKLNDESRKTKLELWVKEFLIPRFWERLLVIDGPVANTWGQLVAHAEKKGRIIPTIDSLLAATAMTHHLTMVTRNIKDFEGFPISLVNPWD